MLWAGPGMVGLAGALSSSGDTAKAGVVEKNLDFLDGTQV